MINVKRMELVGSIVKDSGSHKRPTGSMYGIFTYIWLIFMVNV